MDRAEKPYAGLRVGVKNGGCAGQEYVVEYAERGRSARRGGRGQGRPHPGRAQGRLFLLGSEIDYEATELAAKFVFRNPNETDACGCGESVTIEPAAARDP